MTTTESSRRGAPRPGARRRGAHRPGRPGDPGDPTDRRLDDRRPGDEALRWMLWFAAACAIAPVVVAAIRAMTSDWLPTGDNAYFVIRSRDVLTEHHPLVGAWSSGSQSIDTNVNNFGPLQLDLFAPFTKLAPAAGTALVVALTHAVSIVGIAVTVRRLAGGVTAAVAMAVCAWMGWLMGSASLVEARQHPYLMFVLLWFLCLVWALAAGQAWALPWAAFVGSLIVQTQFAFGFIAGLIAVVGVAAFAVVVRRAHTAWSTLRRPLVVAAVVLVVVWLQPLLDQLFGDGNLGRVLSTPGTGEKPTFGQAARLVASIVTSPGRWVRPSFATFDPNEELTSLGLSAVGLVVLAGALGAAWWSARRRGDRNSTVGVVTAVALLLCSFVVAKSQPVSMFGFTLDNFRWLWPALGFSAIAIIGEAATAMIAGPSRALRAPAGHVDAEPSVACAAAPARGAVWATAGASAVALVIAVANLPASEQDADDHPVPPYGRVHSLLRQLDADDLPDTVLFDRSRGYFGEPYSYSVLLELQELGVEFTFARVGAQETANVYRFGPSRRDNGRAEQQLSLVTGPPAREQRPGATRIAYVSGLDPDEGAELQQLADTIAAAVADGTVDADLDAADDEVGFYADVVRTLVDDTTERPSPTALSEALRILADEGLVAVDASMRDAFERFVALGRRDQVDTVGLFLHPVGTDL